MMNKKVTLLTAGILGLGGLAAMNTNFVFADEVTDNSTEEQTDVFDWMEERMTERFQQFSNGNNADGDFQPGFGPFNRSAGGHMGQGMMHGGGGPGQAFGHGPGARQFQNEEWLEEREAFRKEQFENFDPDMNEEEFEAWFDEHDALRSEHFESMHPQWDEETLEEREAFRNDRRQNNRRPFNNSEE